MNLQFVLVIGMIAVARAATVRYDLDSEGGQGQGDFHATNPTVLESTSGPGIRENKHAQIQSQAFRSQDLLATGSPIAQDFHLDKNLFQSKQQSGVPATTTTSAKSSIKGQFNDISSQTDFYNDKQAGANQQQFFPARQQAPGQLPFYSDNQQPSSEQQLYNAEQQSFNQQQFYNENQKSPMQQQQFYDDKQQSPIQHQQFYNDNQQSPMQHQQFYYDGQPGREQQFYGDKQQPRDQRDRYNMQSVGISDQQFGNKKQFQDVSNQQSQIRGDGQSVQIHSVAKGSLQLSAFDNREQPIALPKSTAMHSASVVVSGLKNLPVLPAMVYNGGTVPSTHEMVYGREPWFQGGASVRQHLQTPFVRYVYSHIL